AARGKTRFAATALRATRRHPKLVLAAHVNLAPIVSAMKLAAPRMKSIVCTHGIEVWEPLPPLRRRALRSATLVLAPSHATADYVVTLQGVPLEFPSGRVVLTVGRWLATERYKGMDTLMAALPRLLLRWPELQLVFIGA